MGCEGSAALDSGSSSWSRWNAGESPATLRLGGDECRLLLLRGPCNIDFAPRRNPRIIQYLQVKVLGSGFQGSNGNVDNYLPIEHYNSQLCFCH
jgi:hypothetical protein